VAQFGRETATGGHFGDISMRWGFTRRRLVGASIGLLAVIAIGGAVALRASQKPKDDPNAQVTLQFAPSDLAYASTHPLARWLPVSGTLQPVHQVDVKAKVSANLRQINVREGEAVKEGQLLARFDTADLDAKLSERQGALESAKAQLALSEKTSAMNTKLLNDKFISQNAFDNSESGYRVAQGSLKSTQAQVQQAEIALRDANVLAPLTGIVAKRHVQPGEKVAFDAPLFTIVDLRDLELQAMVPASDVPELTVGMPVELNVDGYGDRAFTGRIERINPSTEPGTRSILVYITLHNPEAALKGGMFANGRIALASSRPVATLPANAIRTDAGQNYVWVIDGGKLARRVVVVGRRDEVASLVEVKTTLPPDLAVLATRFENLKEGAPVLVRAAAQPDSPKAAEATRSAS
jgi:RND family efflux transporter MFP subunit